MADKLEDVHAVLIDLDGTIFVGDRLVPGAADSIENLRRGNIPMRFGTNISRMPRTAIVKHLSEMGLQVELEEVLTAPLAAASWLERKGLWNLALRVGTDTHSDFAHFTINETSPQAVVIGDMGSDWDFNMLNTAFQQIMDGAAFVALHRNPHWDTGDGLAMDAGALGGKINGSGGGGCMFAYAPDEPEKVAEAVKKICGNTQIIHSDAGTKILI